MHPNSLLGHIPLRWKGSSHHCHSQSQMHRGPHPLLVPHDKGSAMSWPHEPCCQQCLCTACSPWLMLDPCLFLALFLSGVDIGCVPSVPSHPPAPVHCSRGMLGLGCSRACQVVEGKPSRPLSGAGKVQVTLGVRVRGMASHRGLRSFCLLASVQSSGRELVPGHQPRQLSKHRPGRPPHLENSTPPRGTQLPNPKVSPVRPSAPSTTLTTPPTPFLPLRS